MTTVGDNRPTLSDERSLSLSKGTGTRAETLLSVRNLRISFRRPGRDRFVAVHDLNYDVIAGSGLAVVGESGSGKTVGVRGLLRLLGTEAVVESGSATYGEQDLLALREPQLQKLRGREIGMVFQNAMEALNPTLTLERQLTEPLRWHRICNRAEARQRAIAALGEVGIGQPEKRIRMYPFQLSGGMRQRAMIASALVTRPKLIIADEPTTALDVTVQSQILDLLAEIKSAGTAMIMITHDLGVARRICEDVIVMREGEVVESGPMIDILERPEHPYTRALVAATPEIDGSSPSQPEPADRPMIKVAHLTKTFGSRAGITTAVDDVSLSVEAGSTLGLVGESGSGKSTVARLVMGLLERDDGDVTVDGIDPQTRDHGQRDQLRRGMQMVFQNPYGSLLPHYTVGANIAEPLRVHRIGTVRERRERAAELLAAVGLPADAAQRYPQQFSGGQQQRIAVARALATEPKILVCDEPTSSLDVSIQAQVLELLAELQERLHLTCLLISHNLAVVEKMADTVAVMKSGRLVETGAAADVFGNPQHPYTRSLLEAVLPIRILDPAGQHPES